MDTTIINNGSKLENGNSIIDETNTYVANLLAKDISGTESIIANKIEHDLKFNGNKCKDSGSLALLCLNGAGTHSCQGIGDLVSNKQTMESTTYETLEHGNGKRHSIFDETNTRAANAKGSTGTKSKIAHSIDYDFLGNYYKKFLNKDLLGLHFYDYDNTNLYVFFLDKAVLIRTNKKQINEYKQLHKNFFKIITHKGCTIMCISHQKKYEPQFLHLDSIKNFYNNIFLFKDTISKVFTKSYRLFFLDIIALLLQLRDGFLTPTKVGAILLSIYTLHERYMTMFSGDSITVSGKVYAPQSGASITDIMVGLSMLGLPAKVLDAIKTFTTLTGKRLFESNVVMETLHAALESIRTIITWTCEPREGFRIVSVEHEKQLLTLLDNMGSSIYLYKDMQIVCDNYSAYVSKPQVMFDPSFREKIITHYNKLKSSKYFLDYIHNNNNKYFQRTWQLYENNIIKSITSFDSSARDEPISIVFEGEAGSGKSHIMNSFVDLLRKGGMTTYSHSVPSAMDGKDFYDDYENQDIFVMDDIGQQGASQWRYMINFVSPVKYPLPCAVATNKNTKFFNSKVIVTTTNKLMSLSGFTSADCISTPEALYRRCHVIQVHKKNTDDGKFAQEFKYFKYDHIATQRWENKLLHHCANNDVPVNFDTEDDATPIKSALKYVYTLYKHISNSEFKNKQRTEISGDDLSDVLTSVNGVFASGEYKPPVYEPQYVNLLEQGMKNIMSFGISAKELLNEWLEWSTSKLLNVITNAFSELTSMFSNLTNMSTREMCAITLQTLQGAAYIISIAVTIKRFFYKKSDASTTLQTQPREESLKEFFSQGGEVEPERVKTVRNHCRTIVIKEDKLERDNDVIMQCIVSHDMILLPHHAQAEGKYVDLYRSMDHYTNQHKEMENVQLKALRHYPSVDLSVYQMVKIVPLYKRCKQLFADNSTARINPVFYLVNSTGSSPILFGATLHHNSEEITYGKYKHKVNSGYQTNLSQAGACGTVLVSLDHGIVGFHVAGCQDAGFCVSPPESIRKEIRSLMVDGDEVNFELDTRVIPEFSGVRVRYEEKMNIAPAIAVSSLSETILHRSVNEDTRELERQLLNQSDTIMAERKDVFDQKAPPNFKAEGKPSALLKTLSKKTFKLQGFITTDERKYIKSCIESMIDDFDDITDEECAFGGEYVNKLNKDSSNGFGYKSGKEQYFDFENKVIKQEALDKFEEFRKAAQDKNYDYNNFVCRETFKDELRKEAKINTPRTFRVMPLGHIWWSKKIFGKLIVQLSRDMHKTGICLGFNPYKDFDVVVGRLKNCTRTGDIDFGKWDGTILAMLLEIITEVFEQKYKGSFSYMIEFLMTTIAHSFVLVLDELWSTTHGLPSGTWLTLLINCLVNKSLTALTIFRNKSNASVKDFYSVVDYVMGDDKLIGADVRMQDVFNIQTLEAVASSLGMDCTNGDKTRITTNHQPFHKLTFVKRHLRYNITLQKWVGCLDPDTLINTMQWYDTTKDMNVALNGKMQAIQVEALLHSEAFFNIITNFFKQQCPHFILFTKDRVIQILSDNEYMHTQSLAGKDMSWMERQVIT